MGKNQHLVPYRYVLAVKEDGDSKITKHTETQKEANGKDG